jgi:hypothetical protein
MEAIGWQPRSAGWFTWRCAPGFLGVLTAAATSEHAAEGSAWIAPHLGLRDDRIEGLLAELTGAKDDGYRAKGGLQVTTVDSTCCGDHETPWWYRLPAELG